MALGPAVDTFLSNPVRNEFLNWHKKCWLFKEAVGFILFMFSEPSGNFIEVTWDVPESSGPGVTDPNCISYIYYSTVDFVMVKIEVHHLQGN